MKLIHGKTFFIGESLAVIVGLALEKEKIEPHIYITNFNGGEVPVSYSEWEEFFSKISEFSECFNDSFDDSFDGDHHLKLSTLSSELQIVYSTLDEEITIQRGYFCMELGMGFSLKKKLFSVNLDRFEFESFLHLKDMIEDHLEQLSEKMESINLKLKEIVDAAWDSDGSVDQLHYNNQQPIPHVGIVNRKKIRMSIEKFAGQDPITTEIIRTLVDEIDHMAHPSPPTYLSDEESEQ